MIASTVASDPKAVRLLPPLVAGPAEAEEFLAALRDAEPARA